MVGFGRMRDSVSLCGVRVCPGAPVCEMWAGVWADVPVHCSEKSGLDLLHQVCSHSRPWTLETQLVERCDLPWTHLPSCYSPQVLKP